LFFPDKKNDDIQQKKPKLWLPEQLPQTSSLVSFCYSSRLFFNVLIVLKFSCLSAQYPPYFYSLQSLTPYLGSEPEIKSPHLCPGSAALLLYLHREYIKTFSIFSNIPSSILLAIWIIALMLKSKIEIFICPIQSYPNLR